MSGVFSKKNASMPLFFGTVQLFCDPCNFMQLLGNSRTLNSKGRFYKIHRIHGWGAEMETLKVLS